jgi:hypothetical protein
VRPYYSRAFRKVAPVCRGTSHEHAVPLSTDELSLSPLRRQRESQLARDIKTKIRDALTLHSDDWMEKVYARAADFVSKAYSGFTE